MRNGEAYYDLELKRLIKILSEIGSGGEWHGEDIRQRKSGKYSNCD